MRKLGFNVIIPLRNSFFRT